MSTACSLSRCVCSTYSFVFLGTARGISCSGGGPFCDTASRFASRGMIFTCRHPPFVHRISVLSSRPILPKDSPLTGSIMSNLLTMCFSLYTLSSLFASATRRQRTARVLVTSIDSMHVISAGR